MESGLGENLYRVKITYPDQPVMPIMVATQRSISQWYEEIKLYDYKNPVLANTTRHFTQLVWKKTKKLGFGIVENNGFTVAVAVYYPVGNIEGDFEKNVLEPVKKIPEETQGRGMSVQPFICYHGTMNFTGFSKEAVEWTVPCHTRPDSERLN